jgi:plastocyanin domain-containing protein
MRLVWIVATMIALAGCEKKAATNKPAPPAPPSVAADGTRSIPINVNDEGYDPSQIKAKAGEKLELVFTRKSKSACGEQVKVADGPVINLPLDQPVKIAVTAPPSGEVRFACGMDMMTGVIVVN